MAQSLLCVLINLAFCATENLLEIKKSLIITLEAELMTALVVCLCVIGWLAAALFVWALCKAAASADRHLE